MLGNWTLHLFPPLSETGYKLESAAGAQYANGLQRFLHANTHTFLAGGGTPAESLSISFDTAKGKTGRRNFN